MQADTGLLAEVLWRRGQTGIEQLSAGREEFYSGKEAAGRACGRALIPTVWERVLVKAVSSRELKASEQILMRSRDLPGWP